ncbi:MAG: SDR family oxidoreductase [Ignavibacteria bacterium]|jgi:dTDP-4-dehydrorhamnose reductase
MYLKDLVKNRILIVGSNGMLGRKTVDFYLKTGNYELLLISGKENSLADNVDYIQCDITEREKIKKCVQSFYPDFIINAAAYTGVDKSETEREQAWKVNVRAVEYISETARAIDAHIIHISSDYIFDGKNGPYSEDAVPNPLSYYGRTKLASENALKISGALYTILRTNVLYGTSPTSRPDFVKWVVNSLKNKQQIRIVTDQINNPTFIDDLIQAVSKIIEFNKTGIFNIGGREFLSRHEFTNIIAEYFNLDKT